jgi:hypothetical protein
MRHGILFEPLQARDRQQGSVHLTFGELAQTRVHVAAQGNHREVRADAQHLGLAAQAGGAQHGALGQIGQPSAVAREKGIARVLARQNRGNRQTGRQPGRHVFHGMGCDVDGPGQQGFLDLLGEQALAADLGQRPVAHPVAGGLDCHDLHGAGDCQGSVRFGQAAFYLPRLGQGQWATARADAKDRWFRHNPSLGRQGGAGKAGEGRRIPGKDHPVAVGCGHDRAGHRDLL